MDIPATFPCLGKAYNCTTDSPADPDIVGIGVMAAFFATSIATFATISVAYFWDYLPGVALNEVDHFIMRTSRDVGGMDIPKAKRMREGVEAFILTLSDQQLVTGLAILIAGFVKCDISVYSFENVSAIAWFSCTTHLATLTILRRYLREHKVVLVFRVIGMLLIAALLIVSNFMTTTAKSTARTWKESTGLDHGLDICFYCVFNSGSDRTVGYVGIDVIIMFWVLWAYLVRLRALYSPDEKALSGEGERSCLLDESSTNDMKLVHRISKTCKSKATKFQRDLLCGAYFAWFAYQEMRDSYWWEIVWLLFAGAFSLSRVFLVWFSFSDISGNRALAETSTAMGFAQMVALLLLAIPCFSALEAFYGPEDSKTGPEAPRIKEKEFKVEPADQLDPVTRKMRPDGSWLESQRRAAEESTRHDDPLRKVQSADEGQNNNPDEAVSNNEILTTEEPKADSEKEKIKLDEPKIERDLQLYYYDSVTSRAIPWGPVVEANMHGGLKPRLWPSRQAAEEAYAQSPSRSQRERAGHIENVDNIRDDQLFSHGDKQLKEQHEETPQPQPHADEDRNMNVNEISIKPDVKQESAPRCHSSCSGESSNLGEVLQQLRSEHGWTPKLTSSDAEDPASNINGENLRRSEERVADSQLSPRPSNAEEQRCRPSVNTGPTIGPCDENSTAGEKDLHVILQRLGNDPYRLDTYRHILGIFVFAYSIYIIGIGVTMAIAPNVQTFVYASIPFVPEASMAVKEIGVQMLVQVQVYRNMFRDLNLHVVGRMGRDLEGDGGRDHVQEQRRMWDAGFEPFQRMAERRYERHHMTSANGF